MELKENNSERNRPRFVDRAINALDWFDSLEIAAPNSRLRHYRKVTEALLARATPKSIGHIDLLTLTDLDSLIQIYENRIKLSTVSDFHGTLKKAMSGAIVYGLDTNHEPRNYLFQLECAVELINTGWTLVPHKLGDLEATVGSITVLAECKRLSSHKCIQKRLREARSQINARRKTEGRQAGLILMDLTVVANPKQKYWMFTSEEEAIFHGKKETQRITKILGDGLSRHIKGSNLAGVMCRILLPYWQQSYGWIHARNWMGIPNQEAAVWAKDVFDYQSNQFAKRCPNMYDVVDDS